MVIKHVQVLKGCKQQRDRLVWKGRTGRNRLGQQLWLHNLRQAFNECSIGKGRVWVLQGELPRVLRDAVSVGAQATLGVFLEWGNTVLWDAFLRRINVFRDLG